MDRMNPPFNVVISNVPGPRQPLYCGGARMLTYYPVSAVAEGQGLNITVQSYRDHLDFGLIACRELVPDLWCFGICSPRRSKSSRRPRSRPATQGGRRSRPTRSEAEPSKGRSPSASE